MTSSSSLNNNSTTTCSTTVNVDTANVDDSVDNVDDGVDNVNDDGDAYIALCPRGLHHIFVQLIKQELNVRSVQFIGERTPTPSSSSSSAAATTIDTTTSSDDDDDDETKENENKRQYQQHLRTLLSQKHNKRKHSENNNNNNNIIGTVYDPWTNQHVSVGYHHPYRTSSTPTTPSTTTTTTTLTDGIWSYPGNASCVWVYFVTTSSPNNVATLRFIGPLLASVQVWDNNNNHDLDVFIPKQSLEQVSKSSGIIEMVRNELHNNNNNNMKKALRLWYDHVETTEIWPLSSWERHDITTKMNGSSSRPMTYRFSCIRDNSRRYKYTREEFIRLMADYIVLPTTTTTTTKQQQNGQNQNISWKVDLVHYNVEVVLFVRHHCLVIGLSLRPYQYMGTKSFASGTVPPDITLPYLSGDMSTSGLVRLRPTTAQLLIRGLLLLQQSNDNDNELLRPGSVILDPCAGIGTIPLEVANIPNNTMIGIGGDVILVPDDPYRPLAVEYGRQTMKEQQRRRRRQRNAGYRTGKSDLIGWDATMLPLRPSSVDAIVSDLPFGQRCLSASKLNMVLPLILGEITRVLRPNGTMVLLCGTYPIILTTLQTLNELQRPHGYGPVVWRLPCDAVLPVNIGGLIAWAIKVRRGPAEYVRIPNHIGRVRQLVRKREQTARHLRKNDGS